MVVDPDPRHSELEAPKRRRAPKGEQRRAELLDAAIKVFARDGYTAASMGDVAKLVGITTVGLLHHFPNKVALLTAVLERRDLVVAGKFSELDMQPNLENFIASLRAILAFSVEDASISQALMLINTESLSPSHPANEWFRDRFELIHEHLRVYIRVLVSNAEIRADVNVKALAQEVCSVMDGLQIQWLRSPADVSVSEVFDIYLQRLEGSIQPE